MINRNYPLNRSTAMCAQHSPGLTSIIRRALAIMLILPCIAMGESHPLRVSSKQDILNAKSSTDSIYIGALSIVDIPLLAKFKSLRQANFYQPDGKGASDSKLDAFARLSFTNLIDVCLLKCPMVTDQGIRRLVEMKSLKMLQLEGISITDVGCELLASKLQLSGVNVANCSGVTVNGIRVLGNCVSIRNLSFSADKLSQDTVIGLIDGFRNVAWCLIVDLKGRLDADAVRKRGEAKGIKLVIHRNGALQDMQDYLNQEKRGQ